MHVDVAYNTEVVARVALGILWQPEMHEYLQKQKWESGKQQRENYH